MRSTRLKQPATTSVWFDWGIVLPPDYCWLIPCIQTGLSPVAISPAPNAQTCAERVYSPLARNKSGAHIDDHLSAGARLLSPPLLSMSSFSCAKESRRVLRRRQVGANQADQGAEQGRRQLSSAMGRG